MSTGPAKIFLSCDWGTTSFRLRRTDLRTGQVLSELREASGAKALASLCPPGDALGRQQVFADYFRRQVLRLVAPEDHAAGPLHTVISGMASSSVGWFELPYTSLPCPLDGSSLLRKSFDLELAPDWTLRVHLLSGVASSTEMMRGEETELVGLFAGEEHAAIAWNGWVVLPGSHSKHVRLRDRSIVQWHTFMTGELFEVLAQHSLLRVSVGTDSSPSIGPHLDQDAAARDAFLQGVRQALDHGLSASLFQVRTRHVLQGCPTILNRWFLSGLLLGSEIGPLAAKHDRGPILLAAPAELTTAYQLALETCGLKDLLTVASPALMAGATVRAHRLLLQPWLENPR